METDAIHSTKSDKSFVNSTGPRRSWSVSSASTLTSLFTQENAAQELDTKGKSTNDRLPHLHGIRRTSYPPDCPPLNVLWFHAVDIPKRKPHFSMSKVVVVKGPPLPALQAKKFVAFSSSDSRCIEDAYQRLLEDAESGRKTTVCDPSRRAARVPVNEDFLFDVDITERELAPVFWKGPIYEVRRGTWFYQDASLSRPCEESLASQLEEGYLAAKPWKNLTVSSPRNPTFVEKSPPMQSMDDAKSPMVSSGGAATPPLTHRLVGDHMNNIVTYQDASTAWLSSDGMLSWVTTSVLERFVGGGYLGGVKLVRGYMDQSKPKEVRTPSLSVEGESSFENDRIQTPQVMSGSGRPGVASQDETNEQSRGDKSRPGRIRASQLQRQLSAILEGPTSSSTEEQIRQRQEEEIRDDYNAQAGETQGREIDHLILATHGIGQLLGLKTDTVNFIHDVNTMRKSLKSMYTISPDLKQFNSDSEEGPGNCRVQILPVCWRHLLDFPKRKESKPMAERDITDPMLEDNDYPTLEEITVEGMSFARSLISDLALDVLLYQSNYREQISRIVLQETNSIYQLFKERHPNFKGKVHLMGHSLGSAIMFDILCRQKEQRPEKPLRDPLRVWPRHDNREQDSRDRDDMSFAFDVADLYCLGSPIGLFQMIKGRTIAGRDSHRSMPSESPLDPEYIDDPFLFHHVPSRRQDISSVTGLPSSVSSPRVDQIFNIFHPSDPVSYRIEPLISQAMSALKPHVLPYKKKGLFSSMSSQGLTEIGAKVGQSVSGLLSSLSAGITGNLLSRNPGVASDETGKVSLSGPEKQTGSEESDGEITPRAETPKTSGANRAGGSDSGEQESLYAQFHKSRQMLLAKGGESSGDPDWQLEDRKAKRLRLEESKVRALNRNGRVDFCIQEGVLDFNPITMLASHLSYWGDEDVNHFILTQLLSRKERE